MAYEKQNWTTKTPITPDALNHMEDGISKLDEDYIDNQEVATNEYINGKRVYAKRFSTIETILQKAILSIPMNLPDYEERWIDLSNSYMLNTSGNRCMPIVGIYYVSYTDNPEMVSATLNADNILLISKGGWGDNWKKVVTIKYTKKTE